MDESAPRAAGGASVHRRRACEGARRRTDAACALCAPGRWAVTEVERRSSLEDDPLPSLIGAIVDDGPARERLRVLQHNRGARSQLCEIPPRSQHEASAQLLAAPLYNLVPENNRLLGRLEAAHAQLD